MKKITGYLIEYTKGDARYYGSIEVHAEGAGGMDHGPAIVGSLKDLYALHECYRQGKSEAFLALMDLFAVKEADLGLIDAFPNRLSFGGIEFCSLFASKPAAEKALKWHPEKNNGRVIKASDVLACYWECIKQSDLPREVVVAKDPRKMSQDRFDWLNLPAMDSGTQGRSFFSTRKKANDAIRGRAEYYLERHEANCRRFRRFVKKVG